MNAAFIAQFTPTHALSRLAWRGGMLALAALFVTACCHTPPAPSCSAGQVPLVSNTTYAVYQGSGKVQVEDTRTVQNRCIVPTGQVPAGPGSSGPAPVCPTGTEAIVPNTISAEYFGVADASRQLEDMRQVNNRCIVVVPLDGGDQCPPGTRAKVIQGQTYCVPAP